MWGGGGRRGRIYAFAHMYTCMTVNEVCVCMCHCACMHVCVCVCACVAVQCLLLSGKRGTNCVA